MVTFGTNVGKMLILGNPVVAGMLQLSVPKRGLILVKGMDGRTLIRKEVSAGTNKINVMQLAAGTYIVQFNQQLAKIVVN